MSLDTITNSIKQKVGSDSGLNGTIKFMLDSGIIYVDAKQVPNVVSHDDKPADCTVKASADTIANIISGESNAMTAFMMGKIKVEGNMGLAMNITKIL